MTRTSQGRRRPGLAARRQRVHGNGNTSGPVPASNAVMSLDAARVVATLLEGYAVAGADLRRAVPAARHRPGSTRWSAHSPVAVRLLLAPGIVPLWPAMAVLWRRAAARPASRRRGSGGAAVNHRLRRRHRYRRRARGRRACCLAALTRRGQPAAGHEPQLSHRRLERQQGALRPGGDRRGAWRPRRRRRRARAAAPALTIETRADPRPRRDRVRAAPRGARDRPAGAARSPLAAVALQPPAPRRADVHVRRSRTALFALIQFHARRHARSAGQPAGQRTRRDRSRLEGRRPSRSSRSAPPRWPSCS